MNSSSTSEQTKLSPPITIKTNIPFVEYTPKQNPNDIPKLVESGDKRIEVEICSELTKYHGNTEIFEKSGSVQLMHDYLSQPAVFSLDANNRLCLLRHISGAAEGWQSSIISPEDLHLTTFHVMQDESDFLLAAIAAENVGNEKKFSLHYHRISLKDNQKIPEQGREWTQVMDNTDRPLGSLHLSTVMWKGPPDHAEGESPIFHVIVGTKTSGNKTSSIYTVRIDPFARNPWSKLGFPAQASGLDQLSPMALPGGESAMVSVFHDTVGSKPPRCVGHVFGPDGGFLRQFEAKAGALKGVNSVFSHLNPWNTTDLVLAGNDGIGVCDSTQEYDTMSEHILKGITFKQVVCDEVEYSSRPLTHTRLAIFAVSQDDELYYIDGERNYAADEPRMSFQWSGLPIRRNVSQISARYNALQCSSELLMATENDTALRFLRREPSGKSWTEDRITLKGHKTMHFDAFVTNLVFTDGFGKPVPENYKVKLTSEPLHIVANDRSYATGLKGTVLKTDSNGSILIVIPTNGKIACPPLKLSISDFSFKVDPAQRVDRLIGGLNSTDAFSAAKASNGEMIFAGCSPETLTDAASVLGKYGDIKASIHEPSQSRSQDIDFSSSRGNYEWGSWFDNVTSWAEKFLGDCIESIKYVAKETVKLAIRIAGPVVKLVFKIGKALCSFVVKTLDTVLTAVANFLENTLGLDFLSRLLKFFKAMFDPAAVKATQEVVKKAVIGSISLSERFLSVNRSSMEDLLGDAEDMLKGYLGNPKDLPGGSSSTPNVSSVLNNPVVRLISKIDPLSWLMEAITEELTDFKVPSFAALTDGIIKAISPNLINNFSLISKLWDTFFQELCTVLSNPSQLLPALIGALKKVALTLTKVVKEAILSLFDVALTILHELPLILSSSWKLGGLTDIWEELTGQDFSVMNFLTYPIAVIMNVTSVLSSGKLPFEGQTAALASFNFDSVVIKPFYESTRDLKATTSSMEVGGQWGREDVHDTQAESSQLNHFGGIKTGSSDALALPPPSIYANSDSSTTSAKEIFRNLCTIAENFSRIAISLDLLLEAGEVQDRRQRLINDYADGNVTETELRNAIAAQNARPTGYDITKWRILGIFFHSVAIIGGTLLHERSSTVDWTMDCIVGVVGVGEFVVAAASLCGADVEMALQGAGCVVQLNTILRTTQEGELLPSSVLFVMGATAGIMTFACTKMREPIMSKTFIVIDWASTTGGILWTIRLITSKNIV